MKRTFFLLGLLFGISINAQEPAMKKLQPLLNRSGMAQYFSGIFDNLGIRIKETKEAFTVCHKGDFFELHAGIDEKVVDYSLTLKEENIQNLLKHANDGKIDEQESFRILRVLFTPMTQASLNNDFITKKKYLRAADVEELLHVILLDPDGRQNYQQTLIFGAGQWIVVPDLHGKAERTFKLTPVQAIEYQRKLFAAKKANTKKAWISFAKWYKHWKKEVSAKEKS